MRTTIDKAGRVVIPKELRDRLALRGGEQIEVEELNGTIEIRRTPRESRLVESPHGILTFSDGPGLGVDEVRDILERTRRREL